METSLKKLWARQRGKSGSSIRPEFKKTPTYEVHVSGPPPQLGHLPFKPSQDRPAKKELGASKVRSDGSLEIAARPRTTAGIQPVFVGVSRPGTASSLAVAVLKAADNAAQERQATAGALPIYGAAREGAGNARYVDIFRIKAQSHGSENIYNENVAARNLDLRLVALSASSYDPKSIYQENVADRNASIELPRASLDSNSRSQEGTRGSYESMKESRPAASIDHYTSQHDTPPRNGPARSAQIPESQPAPQPRMYSMTAKALASQLPAIPQETQIEARGAQSGPRFSGKTDGTENQSKRSPPSAQKGRKDLVRQDVHHQETSEGPIRVPGGIQAMPNTKANVSRPMTNGLARGYSNTSVGSATSSIPLYRISPVELSDPRSRLHRNTSTLSASPDDKRRTDATSMNGKDASSIYSLSGQSKPPSLKKVIHLPHRTIMDLTGDDDDDDDDVFSGAGIPESCTESPVLHQAEYSPVHPAHSSPLPNAEESIPDTGTDFEVDPRLAELEREYFDLASVNESQRVKVIEEAIRKNQSNLDNLSEADNSTSQNTAPKIGFSAISTVASMSPRSSITASNSPLSKSGHSGLEGIEGVSQTLKELPETTEVSPIQEMGPADLHLPPSAREVQMGSVAVSTASTVSYTSSLAKKGVSTSQHHSKPSLSPLEEEVPDQVSQAERRHKEQEFQNATRPILQASPESLRSTDFVHPSTAFGVHTRDFAKIPSSPATSQLSNDTDSRPVSRDPARKHVDFVPNGVSSTSGRYEPSSSAPPTKRRGRIPKPSYLTFDDEDFDKKQLRAKAALIRLQRSLEDGNFEESTNSPSGIPTSRYNGASAPVMKPRSMVPTSIYTQPRQPAPSKEPMESNEGSSVPQLSYHNMVTDQAPTLSDASSPGPYTHTRFSDDSSRSTSTTYEPAIRTGTYLTPVTQTFDTQGWPPRSPGDVSLSSFPLPSSSLPAAPQKQSRYTSSQKPPTSRRSSLRSMSSTASAFSIPYHMVPGRSSSMRNYDDGFLLDDSE